jgi:uncharacterized protein (TIGR02265 family)
MFDTAIRPEVTLDGALDIDALVSNTPRNYTVKGMFCTRFADLLGDDYERVEPKLVAPPRGGRFVAFKDYPQADYTRIVAAAAAKRFPAIGLREAMRRVARDDIGTFSSSMFGRIVLTVIGDARASLLRVPDAYHRIAPGPIVQAEDVDPRTTRITFEGYRGSFEYVLGQLEGVVISYGQMPVVTVHRPVGDSVRFDVVHGG